jgi:hypothetical protein
MILLFFVMVRKSYVIFGKKDSTAVNLSAIGTGGFVINGENAKDFSGISVSDAGDLRCHCHHIYSHR